jgi:hypothetical protein
VPVIGRLDGQVEEVIIKPVGERARAGGETAGQDDAAPARPAAGPADADEPAAREDEPARRPGALPVWLL